MIYFAEWTKKDEPKDAVQPSTPAWEFSQDFGELVVAVRKGHEAGGTDFRFWMKGKKGNEDMPQKKLKQLHAVLDKPLGTSGFPECDKMNAVREKSQVIGEFIEWLQSGEASEKEEPIVLAYYPTQRTSNEVDAHLHPCSYTIETLLAKYFDIDLDKVEKEKRLILEKLRAGHEKEAGNEQ